MSKVTKYGGSTLVDSENREYRKRLLVATPTTGNVRMEWVLARFGQIIPVNWSQVMMTQYLNSFVPIHYTVANAQNLIVKEVIEKDFEWLLLIEQDNVLPADAFIRWNKYMRKGDFPVVSGLYYTKWNPTEPLVFRGRGNSVYDEFKIGDKVWVDAVPTGSVLISGKLLKAMWDESPEYIVNNIKTRRVFEDPRKLNRTGSIMSALTGTSDLEWCTRVIDGGFLKKAGFSKVAKKKYPFLIDTNIFVRHITDDGLVYPDHAWKFEGRKIMEELDESKQ